MAEKRLKYTQEQIAAIADADALKQAVRGIGRGAGQDASRLALTERAQVLDASDVIPDGWAADGSLNEEKGSPWTREQRDTANDVFTALSGAVSDTYESDYYYTWVQDWYGSGDDDVNPYTVVFQAGGDMYAAPFSYDEDDKIVLGDAVKVRPVTSYVPRSQTRPKTLEWRQSKAPRRGEWERREFRTGKIELRGDDSEGLTLTGYASLTDTPYDVGFYSETISRGAFKRTLSNPDGVDVQLLVNHTGLPLARTTSGTLTLSEDDRGLKVVADLDPNDPDVRALEPKMRRGDVTEMSFAFRATDQDWSEDYSSRTIRSVEIHRGDVSVVSYGASPTTNATLRSEEARRMIWQAGFESMSEMLLELRAGKTLSSASMEVLTEVLNLVADADDAVDRAQPLLADLMGVANPDADDDTDDESDDAGETAERSASPLVLPDYATQARLQFMARSAR